MRHFLANSAGFGGVNAVLLGGPVRAESRSRQRVTDRVAITGLGIVSPIGHDPAAFREALRAGRSGVARQDRFEGGDLHAQRAGLVRDFNPRRLMPTVQLRRMDLVAQFATFAVARALADAGISDPAALARVGLVVGTTRGAVDSFESYLDSVRDGRWSAARAIAFPKLVMSSIGGEVSTALGLKGMASTVVDGTTCGLHALVHGFECLRQSASMDVVVVIASDEIGSMFYRLFDKLGVLSGNGFSPYHPEAAGMVLGEGAVAVVLERLSSARKRSAPLLAEISGYGLASDAGGFMGAAEGGPGLERAVRLALAEARLEAGDVDVVYGHGRGLPRHDDRERAAFGRVFGKETPRGCVLGNTGVAEAASGLFSVAAAVLGMRHGEAYPVLSDGVLEGELDFVRGEVRAGSYRRTLVAGSTEQGNNAALVLERGDA
jgi:3-oxoacyl-[acyl-carrier-protein] synthase II